MGDLLDLGKLANDAKSGEILRDPISSVFQIPGSLIPILPSDFLPATKAAWEDAVMRQALRRQNQKALSIVEDARGREVRRASRSGNKK